MSLFASRCYLISHWGISTGKRKIYIIDGAKYCGMNECSTMITAPIRHNYCSSVANIPSDVTVTVNVNAAINLMAANTG